jgi:hypothetical protein
MQRPRGEGSTPVRQLVEENILVPERVLRVAAPQRQFQLPVAEAVVPQ